MLSSFFIKAAKYVFFFGSAVLFFILSLTYSFYYSVSANNIERFVAWRYGIHIEQKGFHKNLDRSKMRFSWDQIVFHSTTKTTQLALKDVHFGVLFPFHSSHARKIQFVLTTDNAELVIPLDKKERMSDSLFRDDIPSLFSLSFFESIFVRHIDIITPDKNRVAQIATLTLKSKLLSSTERLFASKEQLLKASVSIFDLAWLKSFLSVQVLSDKKIDFSGKLFADAECTLTEYRVVACASSIYDSNFYLTIAQQELLSFSTGYFSYFSPNTKHTTFYFSESAKSISSYFPFQRGQLLILHKLHHKQHDIFTGYIRHFSLTAHALTEYQDFPVRFAKQPILLEDIFVRNAYTALTSQEDSASSLFSNLRITSKFSQLALDSVHGWNIASMQGNLYLQQNSLRLKFEKNSPFILTQPKRSALKREGILYGSMILDWNDPTSLQMRFENAGMKYQDGLVELQGKISTMLTPDRKQRSIAADELKVTLDIPIVQPYFDLLLPFFNNKKKRYASNIIRSLNGDMHFNGLMEPDVFFESSTTLSLSMILGDLNIENSSTMFDPKKISIQKERNKSVVANIFTDDLLATVFLNTDTTVIHSDHFSLYGQAELYLSTWNKNMGMLYPDEYIRFDIESHKNNIISFDWKLYKPTANKRVLLKWSNRNLDARINWGGALIGLTSLHGVAQLHFTPNFTVRSIESHGFIRLTGNISADALSSWGAYQTAGLPEQIIKFSNKYVTGTTSFDAVIFYGKHGIYNASIQSDLKGVTLKMPGSLKKDADEIRPLYMHMGFPASYDRYHLTAQHNGINVDYSRGDPFSDNNTQILSFVGEVEWLPIFSTLYQDIRNTFFSTVSEKTVWAEAKDSFLTVEADILVNRFTFGTKALRNNIIRRDVLQHGISIHGEHIVGEIDWKHAFSHGILGNFLSLDMPFDVNKTDDFETEHRASTLASVQQQFPNLSITIDSLRYRGNPLGQLTVKTQQIKNYIDFYWSDYESEATMQLIWDNRFLQKTTIQGKLKIDRLGYWNEILKFDDLFSGEESFDIAYQLYWNDTPWGLQWDQLNGNITLLVRDLHLSKVEDTRLYFLEWLSLRKIENILKLDFTELEQQGLYFSRIAGDINILNGIAQYNNLTLFNESYTIELSGSLEISSRMCDNVIDIFPRYAKHWRLPISALFLGPVGAAIGGASLLFERVISEDVADISGLEYKLDRNFGSKYHISGMCSVPNVERMH